MLAQMMVSADTEEVPHKVASRYQVRSTTHSFGEAVKVSRRSSKFQKRTTSQRRLRNLWKRERFDLQYGHCAICDQQMIPPPFPVPDGETHPPRLCSLDHITPLSVGGDDSFDNTQAVCFSCNSGKDTWRTVEPPIPLER